MNASRIACFFPGQGAQRKGMGNDLFARYASLIEKADAILGYSLQRLCLEDPRRRLRQTAFTQPALFVVGAMAWLEHRRRRDFAQPAALAGHSLGEYNALFAAGCFDFETGLRLVQRRGALMAEMERGAEPAGMAAVLGLDAARVREVLAREGEAGAAVDLANENLPRQLVLSGPRAALETLLEPLERAGAERCLLLPVSGAFHSRYMEPAARDFERFLAGFDFAAPRLPVIANVTARPYPSSPDDVASLLARQIRSPVRWSETLGYLRGLGVEQVEELGPGRILTKMWSDHAAQAPLETRGSLPDRNADSPSRAVPVHTATPTRQLGADSFRRAYGVRLAYLAGSPCRGVSNAEMVARLAEARLLAFLDPPADSTPDDSSLDELLGDLARRLGPGATWGVRLEPETSPTSPALDDSPATRRLVDAALRHGVRFVEAAGFHRPTPSLVRFRFSGARPGRGPNEATNRLLVAASRPRIAELFLQPADEEIVARLVADGELSADEGELARRLPVASDLCVLPEEGSGQDLLTLLPQVLRLRDQRDADVHVGAGGALGTPGALAAAFLLGADFVRTGAVQLAAVESGLPAGVRRLLDGLGPGETTSAPAAAGFALGARTRVIKKGTLFAARAQKLYDLLRTCESLDAMDPATRRRLEREIFGRELDEIRREVDALDSPGGELDPRARLAAIFGWYLERSLEWMRQGVVSKRLDYQIPCDESLAAFHDYWRDAGAGERTVVSIAERLMRDAGAMLDRGPEGPDRQSDMHATASPETGQAGPDSPQPIPAPARSS